MQKFVTLFILFSTFAGPKCLLAQDSHTYVEKGLAIETSDSMDVFNETYNTKKTVLDDLIAPAIKDADLINAISKYKDAPLKDHAARDILSAIHYDVFTDDKVDFAAEQSVMTLSEALTPDPDTKKLPFDCDTSSYVYLEILEALNKDLPVVLLACPGHVLVRWKFSDGSYLNWETTAGIESEDNKKKYYTDNCTEVTPGSDVFYSMFYYNSASAKYALKDNTGAMADLDKAIKLDPNYAEAYISRGSIKQSLKDDPGAMSDVNKAIELDPKKAGFYVIRGIIKDDLEDYTGAVTDFDKAIELGIKNAALYYLRGLAKCILEDYTGAITDFEKVIELDPKNTSVYKNLETAKEKLKEGKELGKGE